MGLIHTKNIWTLATLLFLLVSFIHHAYSQLNQSNIYSFDYIVNGNHVSISNPLQLSAFNENGYNNQAYFLNSDEIIFSSNYKNQEETDLWILDLKSYHLKRFTNTPDRNEFSPQLTPNSENISCVIQTPDEEQFLWIYPLNKENFGTPVIKNLKNVAYYKWINRNVIAIFTLDEINKLILYNISTKDSEVITENPGRCIQSDKEGNLFFVQKVGNTNFLKKYNIISKTAQTLISMPGETEDFIFLNENLILCTSQNNLLSYSINEDVTWVVVRDLSQYSIDKPSRLMSFRNKLLIISE